MNVPPELASLRDEKERERAAARRPDRPEAALLSELACTNAYAALSLYRKARPSQRPEYAGRTTADRARAACEYAARAHDAAG